jgi:hypothetical protein
MNILINDKSLSLDFCCGWKAVKSQNNCKWTLLALKEENLCKKIITQLWSGSSGRVPTQQDQGLEFKPQYHTHTHTHTENH